MAGIQRRMQSVFASTADPNNAEILNRLKGRRRGWNHHRLGFSSHDQDVPCRFPLYCVELKKHTHTLTDRRWRLLTRGDGGKWSMKAQIINTISCPKLGCPVCLCLTHMLCSLLSPVVLPEPVLLRWHVQRWETGIQNVPTVHRPCVSAWNPEEQADTLGRSLEFSTFWEKYVEILFIISDYQTYQSINVK